MKVLIIGGVAAGASAAARLRRLDETAEIVLFERGPHISFANCGLPYYVGDVIESRDALLVQTPETMKGRFNIDVRVNSDVVGVDSAAKTVRVRSGEESYSESYDVLVLAPGSKPMVPPIPGIDSKLCVFLRNVEDAVSMKERLPEAKEAIVVGGGFIGLETAENLKHAGLKVTLVEAAPHILAPMDSDMSPIMEQEMVNNGIELIVNNGVAGFEETDGGIAVTLADGRVVRGDFCLLSIGVRPDTQWLRDSGLEMDGRGFIKVDACMRTNLPDVYAAGDAVMSFSGITGREMNLQLAGPANRQGRIAADNIAGLKASYRGHIGTSVIKIFGLTGASTGMNERVLKAQGIPYRTVSLHPKDHAGYYPGACEMSIKVIYGEEDKKVLGAQIVAARGADKFIDVIATVIRMKGTMEDLEHLELAYAPPFLSAKSAANYAGFIADNRDKGFVELTTAAGMDALSEDEILIDVRKDEEFAQFNVPGSVGIPLNDLRGRLAELEKYRDKRLVVFCETGVRSYIACRMLTQHGFKARSVMGGYKSYIQSKIVL